MDIKSANEKIKLMTVKIEFPLPKWCIALPMHELKAVNRYCQLFEVLPEKLNTITEKEFMRVRGVGVKSAKCIVDTRTAYELKKRRMEES